ncbi:uncharacterized protein LOC110101776 [Dendrobium catenatum]|uniref:uncharacterized protein LOC110101776 n=1 Tax=Dendrobium catenatum TaxID=906689 RepID=UPI0009F1F72E|nr:uncharacterized protein LOC110101776 [Dendrobium catenatum]
MEVNLLIGDEWDFVYVPSSGLSGGMVILWRNKIAEYSVIDYSSQVVIVDLKVPNKFLWRIATVYGSIYVQKRKELWDMLNKYSVEDVPMVIGGDFNCILAKEDKIGGRRFLFSQGPRNMKNCLMENDLHEVGFIDPKYTWCNNKSSGARILERLDRYFINFKAMSSSQRLVVRHLARIASDHYQIILNILDSFPQVKRNIKFEDCWVSYKASFAAVKKEWSRNYQGDSSQVLNKNFQKSLKSLFYWSKAKLKDLNKLKEDLMVEILELQNKEPTYGILSEFDCWKHKNKVN